MVNVLIFSETLKLWCCDLLVSLGTWASVDIKNHSLSLCLQSCSREVFKQQSTFQEVWIAHSVRYGNMLFLDLNESKFTESRHLLCRANLPLGAFSQYGHLCLC